jgi:hypothetical protein
MKYQKMEGTGIGSAIDVEFSKGNERFTIRSRKDAITQRKIMLENLDKEILDFKERKAKEREDINNEILSMERDIKAVETEAKKHEKETTIKTIDQPNETENEKKSESVPTEQTDDNQ